MEDVCTTEFIAFAKSYDRFQALGCDLLGFAIDSNFAHLAWLRTSDAHAVSTPEGWHPGDKVIVPPPATVEEAEQQGGGDERIDGYVATKEL